MGSNGIEASKPYIQILHKLIADRYIKMQAQCGKQVVRHNHCREVMKCHNHRVDHLNDQELSCLLKKGVVVDGNKMFSIDAKARICVELYARALCIGSASNCRNWTFRSEKLSNGQCIEVAELKEICCLDVKGSFNAKMLTACKEYEVLFDVQLKSCSSGFCHPVKLSLNTPEGCKIESNKCLSQFAGKGWVQIPVGKFKTQSECSRDAKFEFHMHEGSAEVKKGLIVRGVIIRPSKNSC